MATTGLIPRVLELSLVDAHQKALAFCTSRQLRKHMRREVLFSSPLEARGRVLVPEYWAIYYHIGRANMPVIKARNKKYLAWFPNRNDDPRLINGESPIHKSDVVSLSDVMSREEFKDAIKSGKLILSRISPRNGGASFNGNPFFGSAPGEGLAGMKASVTEIARKESKKAMESFLRETGLKKKKITKTVVVRGK